MTPRWPEDDPRHDCRVEVRATSWQEAAWREAARRSALRKAHAAAGPLSPAAWRAAVKSITLSQWMRETLDRAANLPAPGGPGSEGEG